MNPNYAITDKTITFRRFSLVAVVLALLLVPTVIYNYLLFHVLVEIFSIVVAFGIFIIAWNSSYFVKNNFILFIGVAYLFVALLDLLHTISYKGMGVFPGSGADLPTQLWIAGRGLEAVSLFIAPFTVGWNINRYKVFVIFGGVSVLLIASIATGLFPHCFIEGQGLTFFKIAAEYVIVGLLASTLVYYHKKKQTFDLSVYRLIITSLFLTIAGELFFMVYTDVYGITNVLGHFAKFFSFYVMYKAFIETGLVSPYRLLFSSLEEKEQNLRLSEERTEKILETMNEGLEMHKREGELEYVNNKLAAMVGSTFENLQGTSIKNLVPEDKRENFMQQMKQIGEGGDHIFETELINSAGERLSVIVAPRKIDSTIFSVVTDISDQKKTITELGENIKEKEFLLKEVYHRVKNNFQNISSLLALELQSLEDGKAKLIIEDIRSRITTMAMVHTLLYRSGDLRNINIAEYLYQLVKELLASYSKGIVDIQLQWNAEDIVLNFDRAVPCGLLVNEAVTNTIKYAFKDRNKGIISIDLSSQDGTCVVKLSDDGIGFPENIISGNTDSLGIMLIKSFAKQLHGTVQFSNNENGSVLKVEFPI